MSKDKLPPYKATIHTFRPTASERNRWCAMNGGTYSEVPDFYVKTHNRMSQEVVEAWLNIGEYREDYRQVFGTINFQTDQEALYYYEKMGEYRLKNSLIQV